MDALPAVREPVQDAFKRALLGFMAERMQPVGREVFKLLANPASRDKLMRGDLTQLRARLQPVNETPRFATVENWCGISGLSRSTTYINLGNGNLRGIKVGKRLLIDVPLGLAWLDAQPSPQIRPSPRAAT